MFLGKAEVRVGRFSFAVHDVEKITSDLVRTTTTHIKAIPPQVAPELVGTGDSPAFDVDVETVKEALRYLGFA
jgi:hypothetical protein